MNLNKNLSSLQIFLIETVIVTSFFCLYFLLEENMGRINEVNVLPFARQHANPTWIPEDWYYNLPGGYRTAFILIFGNMASVWGFLATSIVGRLLCFSLIASGFVFLARTLQLKLISLLIAVTSLLLISRGQGLIAGEWIVRALEPKTIAYGFILFGITFMLRQNYHLMVLFLGISISFHVLVGGWALLAVLLWLIVDKSSLLSNWKALITVSLIYLVAGSFAISPIIQQLITPNSDSIIPASYVYVYLRTPHHLNPLSWSSSSWVKPGIYFVVFAIITLILWKRKERIQLKLAVFALITMLPFLLGIIIAPWDAQGKFLQYYPFRFGDIMFPLITSLLLLYLLQVILFQSKWGKKLFIFFCTLILTTTVFIQGKDFYDSALALRQFPSEAQLVTPEWKEMCYWIRDHTEKNARFISHPRENITFTWLSERATIAKYKFVPPVSAAVDNWYQRLNDLSGDVDIREANDKHELQNLLKQGYPTLTTQQVRSLMQRYQAQYMVTDINHKLDLEIAHQNYRYSLYYNPAIK